MIRNQRPELDTSILDPILRTAGKDPGKLLYSFSDGDGEQRESYSYGEFVERTNAVALYLRKEGVCARGDRVLLVYPPGLELLTAFFACIRLGVIPVPVSPPSSHGYEASLHRMNFIAADCGANVVLTDRGYYWSMKLRRVRARVRTLRAVRDAVSELRWIVTSDAISHRGDEILPTNPDLLFLQYTSGSTRDPRGVMVTHRNVLYNSSWVFDHPPIGVSWLPQYHDMGLIGACLFVALAGGSSHLFSPIDFLQRPLLWLQAITRLRATASAAPNFAYEFCLRRDKVPEEELSGLDLSSLEILMNGAEPVRADTVRRFNERFARCGLGAGVLSAAYGLAESTLAVANRGSRVGAFDPAALARNRVAPARYDESGESGESGESRMEIVSCGVALGSTEIRIVDVSGDPVEAPPDRVGEIWIDGPAKCRGYWNRPEVSETTFRAGLIRGAVDDARWLRTGDLGFIHRGELFVCGRLKDLIIVRGLNYYPQDIEAIVGEDPAIRNGCVAAFSIEREGAEVLVVVAELRSDRLPESTESINHALHRTLGISASAFTFIRKRTISKTSSGKLMRSAIRDRWLAGELDVIAHLDGQMPVRTSNHDELEVEGTDLPAAYGTPAALDLTFRKRGLTGEEDATLADMGIDSLGLVEFALDLEKHLDAVGALGGGVTDLRWLQRISISELHELLHQVIASAPGAMMRLRRAFALLREEQQDMEQRMMREDAAIDVPVTVHGEVDSGPRGILLTSGTGFFGPFLLRSLLAQTEEPVYVLVRAPDRDHAWKRLEEALSALGPDLWRPDSTAWRERLIPVCADLARPNLGMSSREWENLAENTHAVFHNAAHVNYLSEYAVLRPANVMGTREVLRFASHGRTKVVNHISTTFVFGWSTKETLFEGDNNQDLALLDFGYSQSKWVSEQLVLGAMERGLPARVFRPALISPSLCGGGDKFDIAIRLLAAMVKYGIGTTALNQVSMSPAELVADNVVAISTLPDTVGQTFHVTRDVRSTMRDITDIMAEQTGTHFTLHELGDFVPEVVARCRREDLLFPLLNFMVRSVDNISAMEFKLYDNRNYRNARERAAFAREDPPLRDVVAGIVRFMRRHRLIDLPAPESAAVSVAAWDTSVPHHSDFNL